MFSCATVGPKTKTKIARIAAMTMLALDSHWMPLDTPDIADSRNARVNTETIPIVSLVDGLSTKPDASRPELICSAPRPREQAVPKMVANTANASMRRPSQPSAPFCPISGMKALDSSCLRPRRNVEYAMARPRMAYTAHGCSVQWNMVCAMAAPTSRSLWPGTPSRYIASGSAAP